MSLIMGLGEDATAEEVMAIFREFGEDSITPEEAMKVFSGFREGGGRRNVGGKVTSEEEVKELIRKLKGRVGEGIPTAPGPAATAAVEAGAGKKAGFNLMEALLPRHPEGAVGWAGESKAGKLAWGKIAGKTIGPAIGAGFLLYSLLSSLGRRGEAQKQEALYEGAAPSTLDVLLQRRDVETLARREGRLARNDPEAYEALRNLLSGKRMPRLARGEFVVGGPGPANVSREDVQAALAEMY